MKKYTFASPEARKNIDLRNHSDIIIKAVHDVVPDAVVNVYEDYYTVDNITKCRRLLLKQKKIRILR